MGAPGYYLVTLDEFGEPDYDIDGNPVISGDLVILPIQSRIGVEYGTKRYKLRMKTERGRNWNFPQWNAETRKMVFRLTLAQLAAFQVLDEAVDGDGDPFFFVIDTEVSPPDVIFCRKDGDFIVRQVDNVAHGELVDLVMTIEEEPTGPEITD